MKMPPDLYADLKSDIQVVAKRYQIALNTNTPMQDLWTLFHKAMCDRQYDDEHPGFAHGLWTRVLPYQDRFWLDRFYKAADLNDDHIRTALRKIARDTEKEIANV